MKKAICLLALLWLAIPVFLVAQAATAIQPLYGVQLIVGVTKMTTDVDKVTVFQDRALVERVGTMSIPAGGSRITVQYLPQNIDANSVRVSVSGGTNALLGGVEVFFEQFTPEAIHALKDSIQAIDDRLDELKIEEEGFATQRQFLQSIAMLGGADAIDEKLIISPQNLTAAATFLKTQLEELAKGNTKIMSERRELDKKREQLQLRFDQIIGGTAGKGYRIEVPIETKSEAQFTVRVQYLVYNAYWIPQYDARYEESTGKVALTYYGKISQSTGEDWENSKIVLSTAQPQLGTEPPELSQWTLHKYIPYSTRKGGANAPAPPPMAKSMAEEDMMMQMAAEPQQQLEAQYAISSAAMSGQTVIFDVPGRRTIPADGQSHRVVVAQLDFDAQKRFVTVPKMIEKVYLTAKCSNKSDYLLLPGEVALFQGNDYIGMQSFDEPLGFDEEFQLAMGPVQTIKVIRKRIKEFNEQTGIIGQSKREFFAFEIKLNNNSKSDAEIELKDQIPYSADEDIKVDDVRFDPKPTEQDKEFTGEVVWQVTLKPGEEKKFTLQFSVKYPKGVIIQGL